jgi:hypothetical protein
MSVTPYPNPVDALDPTLQALAALPTSADRVPYFTGVDTATTAALTAFARSLLDDADAAAMRATLGLGTLATQDANAVAITDGRISLGGHASTGVLDVQGSVVASDEPGHYFTVRAWPVAPSGISTAQPIRVEPITGAGLSGCTFYGLGVQNQSASLSGATALILNISSGSNRYNVRASGTAQNYFAGNVGIANSAPSYPLDVTGHVNVTSSLMLNGMSASNRLSVEYNRTTGSGVTIRPSADTGGGNTILFQNAAGTAVGAITTSATATTYATSSDRRLKRNVAPLANALATLRQVRPVAFRWNVDDSPGEGFLADQVQQLIPTAVTGEPDQIDAQGHIVPQGMDHSKLVPWLTAGLQELAARLEAIESALGL